MATPATILPPAAPTVVVTTAAAVPVVEQTHFISGYVNLDIWGYHFTVNPMAMLLVTAFAGLGLVLWKGQRDGGKNSFDVWDLIMDTLPDPAHPGQTLRRASGIKCAFQLALLMSTWMIIDLELKSSPMLPAIFTIYMATWGAAVITKVIFDKQDPPDLSKLLNKKGGD